MGLQFILTAIRLCLIVQISSQSVETDEAFIHTPNKLWLPTIIGGTRANPTNEDLVYECISFWRCVSFCGRRPSCLAISYHAGLKTCWLSLEEEPVEETFKGYVFSRKASWEKDSYQWCHDSCEPAKRCNHLNEMCGKNDCDVPSAPVNGLVLGNLRNRYHWIAYICDRGFRLSGDARRACHGLWNGTEPICV